MKNVLVLYNSKTGFSERYARWISEELQCDLINFNSFDKSQLANYELVVYGAGLFAGHINGIAKIKRWIEDFPKKTWVVFGTGATPSKEGYQELIFKTNFPQAGGVRPSHFFYLLAGINYEKMSLFHRILMKLFAGMSAKKQGISKPSKQTSVDLSNKLYIEDLVRYVRLKSR